MRARVAMETETPLPRSLKPSRPIVAATSASAGLTHVVKEYN